MSKLLLAAMAALLTLGVAYAGDNGVIEKPLVAQSLEGFNREAQAIRSGMQPGGRYEFVKDSDRSRIEAGLTTMQNVLQKNASQNDLNQRDKIALVNAQEEVNGILRHNDVNRLVCERRSPIGSHIPVTTCRTYGSIEEQRREAQKGVSDMSQKFRQPSQGGGN